jgi:hypothetical protein
MKALVGFAPAFARGRGPVCIEKNRGGKSGVNIQIAANVALNRFVDLEVRTEPL